MAVLPDLTDELDEWPIRVGDVQVTFQLRLIPSALYQKIWSHADGQQDDGQATWGDVAVPLLTAGIKSFYDNDTNPKPTPWAPPIAELAGFDPNTPGFGWPDIDGDEATKASAQFWTKYPPAVTQGTLQAVIRYSTTGVSADPKAGSKSNADGDS